MDVKSAEKCGVKLFVGKTEETLIYYDRSLGGIVFDRSKSGLSITGSESNLSYRFAPVQPENGKIKVRIFADSSSVEVFINDGMATMSNLVYPTEGDGVAFYSEGGTATFGNIVKYDIVVG